MPEGSSKPPDQAVTSLLQRISDAGKQAPARSSKVQTGAVKRPPPALSEGEGSKGKQPTKEKAVVGDTPQTNGTGMEESESERESSDTEESQPSLKPGIFSDTLIFPKLPANNAFNVQNTDTKTEGGKNESSGSGGKTGNDQVKNTPKATTVNQEEAKGGQETTTTSPNLITTSTTATQPTTGETKEENKELKTDVATDLQQLKADLETPGWFAKNFLPLTFAAAANPANHQPAGAVKRGGKRLPHGAVVAFYICGEKILLGQTPYAYAAIYWHEEHKVFLRSAPPPMQVHPLSPCILTPTNTQGKRAFSSYTPTVCVFHGLATIDYKISHPFLSGYFTRPVGRKTFFFFNADGKIPFHAKAQFFADQILDLTPNTPCKIRLYITTHPAGLPSYPVVGQHIKNATQDLPTPVEVQLSANIIPESFISEVAQSTVLRPFLVIGSRRTTPSRRSTLQTMFFFLRKER